MKEEQKTNEFIPEVWSKEIKHQTKNASVLCNIVTDKYEGEIENQGDTVRVPTGSKVFISDKPLKRARGDDLKLEVTINKHKYFAFRVNDIKTVQAQPDLIADYSAQGGRGLAGAIDRDILALVEHEKIPIVGTVLFDEYTNIMSGAIKEAIQQLDEAGAPSSDRFLIVSPAQKKVITGMDKFIPPEELKDRDIERTGLVGEIYEVLVYVSRNVREVSHEVDGVPAHTSCVMFHKAAFAFCSELLPRVQAAYYIDYMATSIFGDVLYGVFVLFPELAVEIRTNY
jgi:hypothetical protein